MFRKSAQLFTLLALIIMFFVVILPVFAKPEDQEGSANPTPTPTPFSELREFQPVAPTLNVQALAVGRPDASSEVVERRTETSKHYRIGPNLYQARVSAVPIHYRDANGQWQDIDTRPVARPEGGFEVEASNVKMVFPEKLDQTGLEIKATIDIGRPAEAQLRSPERIKPAPTELFNRAIARQTQPGRPAVELSWQWQPQYLVYADENGPVSSVFPVTEMNGGVVDNSVVYDQTTNQMSLTFRPSSIGFTQELQLAALPGEAGVAIAEGATKLEYVVDVRLSAGIQLYSQGVRQSGAFTTDMLELQDQAGNSLLILPAPHLADQVVSRTSPRTPYRVEPTPDGLRLTAELPLSWLQNPSRQYPLTISASAISASAFNADMFSATKDTWIWECSPQGGLNTSVMWVGQYAAFDCGLADPGPERALAQWSVTSLPPVAVIINPTESELYRLSASDTGGGTQQIGVHRLIAPWSFADATWLNRTSTIPWTNPGAEDDYLVTTEDVVGVAASDPDGYRSMGSLPSVVGAWHTDQYYFPWGDPNDGVIYKSVNESGPNLDRAFAQIGQGNPPLLSVTYTDDPINDFLNPVPANTNFFFGRAPSPDFFQIVNTSKWRAFGVRAPDGRSDYDLFISSTPNYTSSIVAASLEYGNTPDFVAIRPNVTATLYPWVIQWEGTGLYFFRYASQTELLSPGGPTMVNGTAFTFTALSIYQVDMTGGDTYRIRLDIDSGNEDLGLALFSPGGGSPYMTREDALALSDSASFGGSEEILYEPAASGSYGLVVWNNGGTQTSNYTLNLVPQTAPPLAIYLPYITKVTLAPLTNGGFESGIPPWIGSGPGGPMVARRVANPAPGCFSGGFTGQLGTSGQLPNNSIPIGEVKFEQSFGVPANASQLTFNYRVFSYDIIEGASGRQYDRFEVAIDGLPVHTDGNHAQSTDGSVLWASGCKTKSIPIGAYAGRNITLKFSVYAQNAPSFNTWAQFDDVKVQ